MNLLRFRAWDKENKKMYGCYGFDDLNERIYRCNLANSEFRKAHLETVYAVEDDLNNFELMQSTGLRGYLDDSYDDSEEKDVFAGDIIDIFWEEWPMGYYQENHMVGVVDKDETGTAWIIKNAKYEYDTPKKIPSEIDGISVSMSLPDDEDLEEIFLHHFNLTSNDVTILGNIHENPELLEARE